MLPDLRPAVRGGLELLILTATRTNELLEATWDEVDLRARTWTIPADRMKAARAHTVPLSDRAIAILEQAQKARADSSAWIFPGDKPGKPLSNMTLLKAARRVTTNRGDYEADVLVVALGADVDPAATPGLVEGGHEFYTLQGAIRAKDAVAAFSRGRAIVGITSAPFKCPPAPSETVLLLDEFLTPSMNKRTDGWGGPLENRARLLCDTLRAIRARIGDEVPLWIRINAVEHHKTDGETFEDQLKVIEMALQCGIDAVHLTAYANTDVATGPTDSYAPHVVGSLSDYAAIVRRRS